MSFLRTFYPPSVAASRQRLLRAMCRFEQRLADRVIVESRPATEAEMRSVRELSIQQDWDGQIRRLRAEHLRLIR